MYRLVKLTNGEVTKVDEADYELVMRYNWYYKQKNNTKGRYARTRMGRKFIALHRFLLKVTDPKIFVDHINGDTLDNRRENLRLCGPKLNNKNKKRTIKKKTSHASKYKGVHRELKNKKWRAKICVDYKSIHLGCFDSEIEAAKVYDQAALKYFGSYAKINGV